MLDLVQNIHKSHVYILGISNCGISSATIDALAESINMGPKILRLTRINISYNTDISFESIKRLISALVEKCEPDGKRKCFAIATWHVLTQSQKDEIEDSDHCTSDSQSFIEKI